MLHPFISTLIRKPNLLIDHLAAYAALIGEEVSEAGSDMVGRAVAWILVGVFATLFVIFAGVALMLGLLMAQFHWVLVAVPGALLLATCVALVKARKPSVASHFSEIKAQMDRDAQALRAAS